MIWIPLLWYIFFFFGPVVLVLVFSFLKRGTYGGIEWIFNLENFQSLLNYSYLQIIGQSVLLAAATTIICAFVALPLTWKIATYSPKKRNLYIFLVSLPFFMNSLARIYSIKLMFYLGGPIDDALNILSITHDILNWSQSQGLVLFGMTLTYLPFMIFPIYAAFEKLDFSIVEAASDLGADSLQVFRNVLIPVLKKPIFNGALLVFIPSLGEYLIPDLLGGAKNMLIGNFITQLFLKARDWPLGAALTLALLVILLAAHKLVSAKLERKAV